MEITIDNERTIDIDRDEFLDDVYRYIQESDDEEFDDLTYLAAMSEEIRRKGGSIDDVLFEFFDNTSYDPIDYTLTESRLNDPKAVVKTPDGEYSLNQCEIVSE